MSTFKPRYLTKSIFKTACECPTKLSYLRKPEFWNVNQENAFLRALAQGGFQVGELAKVYHPSGIQIDTLDYEEALRRTDEALKNDTVTIYEGAFRFNGCFIRADIVKKEGSKIELIEVKAKSFRGNDNSEFWTKNDTIDSSWRDYLADVAFQAWVINNAKPEFQVRPYLMLADKSAQASIDGINQRFLLISDPKNPTIKVKVAPETTKELLGTPLLKQIEVSREVAHILNEDHEGKTFEEYVSFLASHFAQDIRIPPQLSRLCRACEYRIPKEKMEEGFKSGFNTCWNECAKFDERQSDRQLTIDIWRLNYLTKDKLLALLC